MWTNIMLLSCIIVDKASSIRLGMCSILILQTSYLGQRYECLYWIHAIFIFVTYNLCPN